MIFCDECWNCTEKIVLESEIDSAKKWWREYHLRYIFHCGAFYHPECGFAEVHKGCLPGREVSRKAEEPAQTRTRTVCHGVSGAGAYPATTRTGCVRITAPSIDIQI